MATVLLHILQPLELTASQKAGYDSIAVSLPETGSRFALRSRKIPSSAFAFVHVAAAKTL
jgi:hypothetical protein